MTDDYADHIQRIRKATTLEQIQAIAREFPARPVGEGGLLYSRKIGTIEAEAIALELADKTGQPIINRTPRAQFLAHPEVDKAITKSAERIFAQQGQGLIQAAESAVDFRYGNPKAIAQSATSLEGCLWGEASREFAGSLRGDVKVIASNANVERVFGKVELPAALDNPNIRTLGGQPVGELKALYAKGGADAVLPRVQAPFIEAARHGLFIAPENAGPAVPKVALSREAAVVLGADAGKFSPAAELAGSGLRRAPMPPAMGMPVITPTEAALASEAAAASRGLRPGTVVKGLGVVGVAALGYDLVTTGHQVLTLEAQSNTTGAESAKAHFVGRNVGGFAGGIAGGFLAGAGYGLAGGSPTGPGALVTGLAGGVVGGVGGAFLGERWAQQKDIDRVFTQQDRDGNDWSREPDDPNGRWTRVAPAQRVTAATSVSAEGSAPIYSNVRYVAGAGLANQLNYKSANASYELGLANVAKPQNPFSLPPGEADGSDAYSSLGNWERNPQTQAWTRAIVIDPALGLHRTEEAGPQRAAELEQAARLIIAQNAANAPAAIAARYRIAYNQFGWDQYGEVPAAIRDASTRTNVLQASDGDTYTRGADGEWSTPGALYGTNQAQGNLRDELNAVHESQRAGLQELSVLAVEALAQQRPSPPSMRDMVAAAYSSAGVPRTEAEIDAATAAVARTHAREGLNQAPRPHYLVLQPDPTIGRPGPDSALVTMMDDGRDGFLSESRMVPRAITSSEEIRQAGQPVLESPGPTGAIEIRPMGPPASPAAHGLPAAQRPVDMPAIQVRSSPEVQQGAPAPERPRPAQASLDTPAPSAPPVTPDFRNPHHPLHARYQQALDAVDVMEEKHNIPYTEKSERLAAAITGATQPIPQLQIGHLELVAGTVTVHGRRDNFAEPLLSVRVDTSQAIARNPEQHAAAWQANAVPGSQPTVVLARLPAYAPDQIPAQDLRHPQHSQHRLYAQAGDALALAYAQIGLSRTPEQLEREALGLAVASRQNHLEAINGVKLLPDAQGQYGLTSNLMAYQGNPDRPGASRVLVPAAALQVPTEQSVAQFSQVDLAVQLAQQDQQRRQQERNAQASQGPVMG